MHVVYSVKDKRVQVSFRIPEAIYEKIKEKATRENRNATDLFTDALKLFLGEELPGLCPVCHHLNTPDSLFCNLCGTEISSDLSGLSLDELEEAEKTFIEEKKISLAVIRAIQKRKQKEKGENS